MVFVEKINTVRDPYHHHQDRGQGIQKSDLIIEQIHRAHAEQHPYDHHAQREQHGAETPEKEE